MLVDILQRLAILEAEIVWHGSTGRNSVADPTSRNLARLVSPFAGSQRTCNFLQFSAAVRALHQGFLATEERGFSNFYSLEQLRLVPFS
jgi:hypothetical protein